MNGQTPLCTVLREDAPRWQRTMTANAEAQGLPFGDRTRTECNSPVRIHPWAGPARKGRGSINKTTLHSAGNNSRQIMQTHRTHCTDRGMPGQADVTSKRCMARRNMHSSVNARGRDVHSTNPSPKKPRKPTQGHLQASIGESRT